MAAFEHIIISLAVILFAAKLFAELFQRVGLPIVLGELLAGIIVGPYALGGVSVYYGQPLVTLDTSVVVIGEISAVVILFVLGLEITPSEFVRRGASSLTVGSLGVAVPLVVGYYTFVAFGLQALQSMLIATALAATSIAISVQTLSQMGKMQSPEARLVLGAAVVDDVLAIAVLSVVTSNVSLGEVSPTFGDAVVLVAQTLGVFALILVASVLLVPRILHLRRLWKSKGSIEAVSTALFFGVAGVAGIAGLSPIIGAFAVGMAVATSHVIKDVGEYVDKLNMVFAPLFFGIIGAQVNLGGFTSETLLLTAVITAVALLTKVVGCGLPAMKFLSGKGSPLSVGVGMMARMEVALVVAGIGLESGIFDQSIFSAIVAMAAVSSVVTPLLLKVTFRRAAS